MFAPDGGRGGPGKLGLLAGVELVWDMVVKRQLGGPGKRGLLAGVELVCDMVVKRQLGMLMANPVGIATRAARCEAIDGCGGVTLQMSRTPWTASLSAAGLPFAWVAS